MKPPVSPFCHCLVEIPTKIFVTKASGVMGELIHRTAALRGTQQGGVIESESHRVTPKHHRPHVVAHVGDRGRMSGDEDRGRRVQKCMMANPSGVVEFRVLREIRESRPFITFPEELGGRLRSGPIQHTVRRIKLRSEGGRGKCF
eukprot:GFKZ01013884.1.p2 GENE.GFKZ01013884.1~~GFKZ01013884.1.p2  ORF type:complete len:145 (+),score=5.13 GFKZ01013884.1:386-820(+)